MGSESEKLNVIFWVHSQIFDSLNETSYGSILPLHDHSQKCAVIGFKITCKCGKEGKHNINFEVFAVFNGSLDSSEESINDLIFYVFIFWSWWNKELVFNVNVMFGLRNHLQICNVDTKLCLFGRATNWPVSDWPQKLTLMRPSFFFSIIWHILPDFFRSFLLRVNILVDFNNNFLFFWL